ncbi:MAG: sigma-54-dependent transcriptional regulator [Nitrospinales bacterium]
MSQLQKILICDDEENILWVFKKALEKKGFAVDTVSNAMSALEQIKQNEYLLVFTDIFMEGMSGLELLDEVKKLQTHVNIVVMTAMDTMNNTIEAMRGGAYDYISKPFDFEEIYKLLDRAVKSSEIEAPLIEDTIEPESFAAESIVGKSKKMQTIFKTIGKAAVTDLSVLVTGESGTGKEMVARALHFYSNRSQMPFICINCAAISIELLESELFGHEKGSFTGAIESKKGKFELAHNGTIFLDEIGDMEISLQAKILRVLQNNEFYKVGGKEPIKVDVRVVAATNQDLAKLMKEKMFREDLFHRLNVIHINIPPLRERPNDVLILANHFLKLFSPELAQGKVYLSPAVENIFQNYQWPGNIREMENVMKQAIVLAGNGPILREHLPSQLQDMALSELDGEGNWENLLDQGAREFLTQNDFEGADNLYDSLIQAMEKSLFSHLLEKNNGNQVATAKSLGINRNTLKRKIDAMDIQPKKLKDIS